MSVRLTLQLAGMVGLLAPALAWSQSADMHDMPGMAMPQTDRATTTDPHAGHHASSAQASNAQEHAGHDMPATDTKALPPNDHVPPAPPQHVMSVVTPAQMTSLMQMDDAAPTAMLLVDRLERSRSTSGEGATSWEAEAWFGHAIDRLWLKTEGERDATGSDGRIDLLWSHAWTSFWDGQLGVRQDIGLGPKRQWLAAGVQGLAPYWFESQATFYVGEQGRTALRLETRYELLFTQRLILEPKIEMNIYGKDDPQRGVSSGLSDAEAGLRLRYEVSRKFAPYVGVNWTRRFGSNDATPALHARETTWVAGVRWWL
ncbi:MAG TPA: copper resistance protein B [Dyella sp.]|uniref:copper resistance protein B n=1 Tax=Dyella sp. TaxID=1869338 RepID=UPI002D78F397|nr:copper resistance protein B [Dyella sp.]HET6552003.1 copper resistance protein B [Dyella sp.]